MNHTAPYLLSLCLLAPAAGPALADEGASPSRSVHPTHLLNFALLIADKEPAKEGDELAPPVAKAIADVREFLPFKHYRLYDSALIRASNLSPGHVELSGMGRGYSADFICQGVDGGRRIEFRKFELKRRTSNPPARGADAKPAETPFPDRTIISTSFSIALGETIVVGTSTIIDQSLGLIIVLTALPAQ